MSTIELERASEREDRRAESPAYRSDRLQERERSLRRLLVDARDALVRQRVGWRPAPSADGAVAATDPPSLLDGDAAYSLLRERIGEALAEALPDGAHVLFVGRGDDDLLRLVDGGTAWHFPRAPRGGYAGHHPRDSRAAIDHLENLRARGAEFLVLPATSLWWLEHYVELAEWLGNRYPRVVDDPDVCVVHDLRSAGRASVSTADGEAPARRFTGRRRPLAAVTIISRNYLSQARVLAESFHRHEPDGRFYVLVVDRLPEGVELDDRSRVIDPGELEIPGFWEMCFKYGIVEFNTAVKPFLLDLLLDVYDEEEVVYFDPDIMITRPLDELRDALDEGSIVLTPHITRPVPMDDERPSEQDIMISGAYNLGFIALRRSEQTGEFLQWWQERLEDGCRIDVRNGLFTDQKWIDLVPSLFPTTTILRDPTYNVAFWNLHERSISRSGIDFLVNGRPAAFFHISGFDPGDPTKLSKHQTRTEVVPGTALAQLLQAYADALFAHGYEESSGWDYGYSHFADGTPLHPLLRQIYLNLEPEERRRFGDPFATGGPGSFLDWATRPRTAEGELSVFLETVYRVRYDLPTTFPDVRGRDREAFLRWARRWGAAEMGFDPSLVRDDDDAPATDPGGVRTAASNGHAGDRRGPRPEHSAAEGPATGYQAVVERIRDIARTTLPAGSRVLVLSKGDYRLTDLGGSEGWHFPQTEDGVYGGYHPTDSRVAIAHLEALRRKGAGYLLIPRTALWWLEYYEGFRRHLENHYRLVVRLHDTCVIYALDGTAGSNGNGAGPRPAPPLWRRWWRRVTGPATFASGRQEARR